MIDQTIKDLVNNARQNRRMARQCFKQSLIRLSYRHEGKAEAFMLSARIAKEAKEFKQMKARKPQVRYDDSAFESPYGYDTKGSVKRKLKKSWIEGFLPERIDYAGSIKAGITEMLNELDFEVGE